MSSNERKKISRSKKIHIILCSLLYFICLSNSVAAFDDTPRCFSDLAATFFAPAVVMQAFSIHNVDQSQWNYLVAELNYRSRDTMRLVRMQADRLNPSPLEFPFNPDIAGQILLSTLHVIFRNALYGFQTSINGNFINDYDVNDMFEYIKTQQWIRLRSCLQPSPVPNR